MVVVFITDEAHARYKVEIYIVGVCNISNSVADLRSSRHTDHMSQVDGL
jgi:hypothetical protein